MKFHWRLTQGKDGQHQTRHATELSDLAAQPNLPEQIAFAQQAERMGIDSLLVDFAINKPDSILLAAALGAHTRTVKFIIACRSGVISPTYFVQQLNTLSQIINGRFSLNIVAGHSPAEQRAYGDFLAHDERYARTTEYLQTCLQLWHQRQNTQNFSGAYYRIEAAKVHTHYRGTERGHHPDLFIAGSSPQALHLARDLGDIWISLAQPANEMEQQVKQMVAAGKRVALRMSIICRDTHVAAVAAAEQMVVKAAAQQTENHFVQHSDSLGINRAYQETQTGNHWLTDCLWNGAVSTHGASAIALVGSAEEIANAIKEYLAIGVSEFIFSGWTQLEEMNRFGQQVMPLLTRLEPVIDTNN